MKVVGTLYLGCKISDLEQLLHIVLAKVHFPTITTGLQYLNSATLQLPAEP